MNKEKLRAELKDRRLAFDKSFIEEASKSIAERCGKLLDDPTMLRAHIYQTHSEWREVDTSPLIELLKSKYPDMQLEHPTPHSNAEFSSEEFDVVIVPVLGFDNHCNRIGLGAGWYDRFLATQTGALKIGLAFEACRVNNFPVEKHDVQLNYVITEVHTLAASGA